MRNDKPPTIHPSKGCGRLVVISLLVLAFSAISAKSNAQNRFPRPEFQNQYVIPTTTHPPVQSPIFAYVDMGFLLIALGLAAYLTLKKRSRRGVFLLMLASLAYLGFFRRGCICPVGSIQNVTIALVDTSVALSPVIIVLFLLPLIAALLFGRVFCSSVCPLGGIQDLVAIRPVTVPAWLERPLSLGPHIMLGVGILFAATGAGFPICRIDPFVGIFRRSAPVGMAAWGAFMLLGGIFVARPYCRFLCPYGVLLGWMSRLSRKHVTISPAECVNCRLCEKSCPFGAILPSTISPAPESRTRSVRRVLLYGALMPVWFAAGVFAGYQAGSPLSHHHHQVRLAEQILREERGGSTLIETRTFRGSGTSVEQLIDGAKTIKRRMQWGTAMLGGYMGIVVGLALVRFSLQRPRAEYAVDTQRCLSCARCFRSCPIEHRRIYQNGRRDSA